MSTYYMNELAFDLPDAGFVDRTVYDLDGELPGGDVLGLLVLREPIPPGKSLREVVDEHRLREAKRLGAYAVLGEREAEIAGAPAIELSSRWRHERGVFYTREAHLAAGHTRLVFALTTVLERREACDEHLERVLATLRLREP